MMDFSILGCGVWGRGLEGFAELRNAVSDSGYSPEGSDYTSPKPEAISARERRRSGALINLAVQVAHEACENAQIEKSTLASVFVSSMSDTAITDYMCRKLTTSEKTLSPTKFHNSVHNAPSGYWSISAENRAPSSFVGGFDYSVGAGLLEAISQSHAAHAPVLFVAYDIANEPPFHDIQRIDESLGVAFVISGVRETGDEIASGSAQYRHTPLAAADALATDRANLVHAGLREFGARTSLPGALALAEWCAGNQGESQADGKQMRLTASAYGQLELSLAASH